MELNVRQSLNNLMESKVEYQFLNEYVDKRAFKKLDKSERQVAISEYALCEFVNASQIVDSLFKGKKSINNEELSKISMKDNAFFKDVDRTAGDITKTKYHKHLANLLNYAVATNQSSSFKSDKTAEFTRNAYTVLDCMKNFEKSATRLKQIIQKEATSVNNKQLGSAFYALSVYLLQTTGDLLYSTSLRADFDYSNKTPIANNLYFEYNNDSSAMLDEMIMYINYLNTAFANGKIFSALETTLQESFSDAEQKIILNESVLDTVFGLVSYYKTLDLLVLWPIYLTRAIAYWVMYTYTSLKNIALDVESSVELRKKQTITKSEYDDYHNAAMKRGVAVSQSLARADVTMEMSAQEDKKALQSLQSSQNNVLI
jgi:hypothetical protein